MVRYLFVNTLDREFVLYKTREEAETHCDQTKTYASHTL